MAVILKTLILQ